MRYVTGQTGCAIELTAPSSNSYYFAATLIVRTGFAADDTVLLLHGSKIDTDYYLFNASSLWIELTDYFRVDYRMELAIQCDQGEYSWPQ